MGEIVCTVQYRQDDRLDLVLPDHIPVNQLAQTVAIALGMPQRKEYFYELAISEGPSFRRLPGMRSLQQAFIRNGSVLQLIQEKATPGATGFLVADKDTRFRLRDRTLLGRLTRTNFVDIDLTTLDVEKTVSRNHATILFTGDVFLVKDNGSRNGTFVNGIMVPRDMSLPLHPGDELCIGSLEKGVHLTMQMQ
jgi:hypothetical protein